MMKRLLGRLRIDTASVQMTLILICSTLATFVLIGQFLSEALPDIPPVPGGPWPDALAIQNSIQALRAAPPASQQAIAQRMSTDDLRFQVGAAFVCSLRKTDGHSDVLRRILVYRFGGEGLDIVVRTCVDQENRLSTLITIPNEKISILAYELSDLRWPQIISVTLPLIVAFTSLLITIVALSIWCLRRIVRPLKLLGSRVDAFGYDVSPEPLVERGPIEIRNLARTLNRMQARISQAAEERTRMLMAVGHDLRTPLTRLALRLETGGDELDPAAMRRDLTLMTRMLNGALSFLAGQEDHEEWQIVDIGSLVSTLCDDFSDVGYGITCDAAEGIILRCQPLALSRAISNLIENAVKYGENVRVSVHRTNQADVIDVTDNGPGIPAEARSRIVEPFVRLDSARASSAGFGLGLSIVQSVVRRHGGILSFSDAVPHGLVASISLPLSSHKRTASELTAVPAISGGHQ